LFCGFRRAFADHCCGTDGGRFRRGRLASGKAARLGLEGVFLVRARAHLARAGRVLVRLDRPTAAGVMVCHGCLVLALVGLPGQLALFLERRVALANPALANRARHEPMLAADVALLSVERSPSERLRRFRFFLPDWLGKGAIVCTHSAFARYFVPDSAL